MKIGSEAHKEIPHSHETKRRSTGQGAKRPFDHPRPEKHGSRMAPRIVK